MLLNGTLADFQLDDPVLLMAFMIPVAFIAAKIQHKSSSFTYRPKVYTLTQHKHHIW